MRISNSLLWTVMVAASFSTAQALADTITVRADAWCPYNCEPGPSPGYGIELMQEIFKGAGHTVDYKIQPWARALADTKGGKNTSAIGASETDIKEYGLKGGSESIGLSSNCVFVKADNKAKYTKADDLGQFKKIGIINDYTYSEDIDAWLKNPANKGKIDSISGDEPVVGNARKLEAGRIDAVIEDAAVMGYSLNKMDLSAKIVSVGCSTGTKIFVAFSPKAANVDALVKQFDDGIVSLRKSGKLKEILAKYGAKDWK